MGAPSSIAVYGAVTGTLSFLVAAGSLGWQVYSWQRARRSVVRVRISNAVWAPPGRRAVGGIVVNVDNRSDHPVRVNSVAIQFQDGSDRTLIHPMPVPGATLPGVVAPHDSGSTLFEDDELAAAGIDLHRRVIAEATLSSGQTFRGTVSRLRRAG